MQRRAGWMDDRQWRITILPSGFPSVRMSLFADDPAALEEVSMWWLTTWLMLKVSHCWGGECKLYFHTVIDWLTNKFYYAGDLLNFKMFSKRKSFFKKY